MLQLTRERHQRKTPAQREDEAMLLISEMAEDMMRHDASLSEKQAYALATAAVDGMRMRHGARRIYVPGVDKARRDAAIYARFNGQNAAEVCRTYGISRSRLYQIVGARVA